ncbi:acyltransferase family protein [Bradyrhizobium sp. SYSU BS000235]|uniref:acyltransferase family protein n=1 Tax=Bradyrhizobium sp. SYSU BS000235 TaxID=3411332 RepID=UPI003C77A70B
MRSVSGHRRDIDWLRAVAVITVIGFHFEIPGFRGGFVGVDIFFVISGLLIGRIIQSEMAAGTFSFLAFYERRIRRLIPALYVMLIIVAVVGGGVLFGAERSDFLRSILGVATFTSNIMFWSQSGYFARAAAEKPLLHTWSLGIEEQFYILLPLVLWLLFRIQNIVVRRACIAATAVCSLILSQWLLQRDTAGAFFLLQSRAWELLAGVMLTWLPAMRLGWIAHALRVMGLMLVVVAVLSYTPRSPFPGLNALLPVAGAALFLSAGPTSLRARPVELIGQMSYSLYLWHWPIFTLAKLSSVTQTVAAAEKLALFALLAAAASASYFLIERRFRYARVRQRTVFVGSAAATALLVAVAVLGTSSAIVSGTRTALKYDAPLGPIDVGSCFAQDWVNNKHPECFSFDKEKQVVLLWGDSFAAQYYPGLKGEITDNTALLQATAGACFPTFQPVFKQRDFCDALASQVGSFLEVTPARLLIMSADWWGYSRQVGTAKFIASLKATIAAARGPVVLIGPSAQFRGWLPSILGRAYARTRKLPASQDILVDDLAKLDREMKSAFSSIEGVTYVSALDIICPHEDCPLVIGNDVPLTWDHAHLTLEGSKYTAHLMAPLIFSRKVAEP